MPTWTVTVAGTNVSAYVQKGMTFSLGINERPTCRLQLKVRDGVAFTAPVQRNSVFVADDGVDVFGGFVWAMTTSPVINKKHRLYDLDCVGLEALTDVVLFNGIVGPGTMESMLDTVMANMSVHGVDVDPAQVTGPSLNAMGFNFSTIRTCLDAIAGAADYNVVWSPSYVRLEDPGTVGAPFALTESNSTITALSHVKSLADYRNEVWVIFGDSSQRDVIDGFTGNGSNKIFALHYPVAVQPGSVVENGVTFPVEVYGGSSAYRWYYRASDASMVVNAAQAAPTNLHIITVPFTAQFPGAYLARDAVGYAANGPWTIPITYPDVFEWSQARDAGTWELARRKDIVRRVSVQTFRAGLFPGMSVNITATNYGLSSTTCLITKVSARHVTRQRDGDQLFEYNIEALEGSQYQLNWQEYYRSLTRSSGAGSASGVVGGGGGSVTTVRGAYWGGSLDIGKRSATWVDVPSRMYVPLDGTSGIPHTVRVEQYTDSASTSVQTRIVKVSDGTVMATSATGTSTSPDEELLTFTPGSGSTYYKLQMQGGNANNNVYALGQSL